MDTSTHIHDDIEIAMYWRDYVLLPLLGFFATVFIIVQSGSILYPLIGYLVAMAIVGTILVRHHRAYATITGISQP